MAERQGWARCQPGAVLRRAASDDKERSAAPLRPDYRLCGALAKSGGGSAPKKRRQGGFVCVFWGKQWGCSWYPRQFGSDFFFSCRVRGTNCTGIVANWNWSSELFFFKCETAAEVLFPSHLQHDFTVGDQGEVREQPEPKIWGMLFIWVRWTHLCHL